MAWAIFWFPILYGLLPLGAGLCFIVGFSSFSPLFCSFLQSCYHSCCTALLFLLWCYLTQAYWGSLGLLLILLSMTQYGHLGFYYIACGLLCPIFPLGLLGPFAFLGPFSNSTFPWAFTNSFGLPWPNYLILHPWGLWACHQPLTFFACITLGLLWPILTFLYHILPIGLLLLSLRAPLGPFASSRPICLFYGPMFHYSCHLGLMVFLFTY